MGIEEKLACWLLQNSDLADKVSKDKKSFACEKMSFDVAQKLFDLEIDEKQYNSAINGAGNEKDKIKAVYSSSLQSFLFFSNVKDKDNYRLNIKLGKKYVEFTEAYFEFKNPVIKSPSSMDVVLLDKAKKNILFIESKLCEIIRDSRCIENIGDGEVGISYFNEKEKNGYWQALNLSALDLLKIGIEFPRVKGKGNGIVYPIDGNSYVYQNGIKQALAHVIGIKNYIKNNRVENEELKEDIMALDIEKNKVNVYFMELYNSLPNFDEKEAQKKQEEYKKHLLKVKRKLNLKEIGIKDMLVCTYQDLYRNANNAAENKKYLLNDRIENFYHLNGK